MLRILIGRAYKINSKVYTLCLRSYTIREGFPSSPEARDSFSPANDGHSARRQKYKSQDDHAPLGESWDGLTAADTEGADIATLFAGPDAA